MTSGHSLDDPKLFIGPSAFSKLVTDGRSCLICCEPLQGRETNREHVIPNWILRRYGLHNRHLRLPYGDHGRKYDRHKLPCCKACNSLLGRVLEDRVRSLTEHGYARFVERLDRDVQRLIFVWLAWIFLKLVVKDGTIPINPDRRVQAVMQDKEIDWIDMHHIHCLARSPYTGARIAPEVLGSMLALPIVDPEHPDEFHFVSIHPSRTIMIRLGDIALMANLNDSGGSMETLINWVLPENQTSFTLVQALEICAELATINLRIRDRPEYFTTFDELSANLAIEAFLPRCCINETDPKRRAEIFKVVFRDLKATRGNQHAGPGGGDPDKSFLEALEKNEVTFLRHRRGSAEGS